MEGQESVEVADGQWSSAQRYIAFLMTSCRLVSVLCCDRETRTPRVNFSPAEFNGGKEK